MEAVEDFGVGGGGDFGKVFGRSGLSANDAGTEAPSFREISAGVIGGRDLTPVPFAVHSLSLWWLEVSCRHDKKSK